MGQAQGANGLPIRLRTFAAQSGAGVYMRLLLERTGDTESQALRSPQIERSVLKARAFSTFVQATGAK